MVDSSAMEFITSNDVPFQVDAEDIPRVEPHRWYAMPHGYIRRNTSEKQEDGSTRHVTILLHRLVAGVLDKPDMHVEHWDGDPRNNRRSNLRVRPKAEHRRNCQKRSIFSRSGASPYRGVRKAGKAWEAVVIFDGSEHHLGRYASDLDAARAASAWRVAHQPEVSDQDREFSEGVAVPAVTYVVPHKQSGRSRKGTNRPTAKFAELGLVNHSRDFTDLPEQVGEVLSADGYGRPVS